MGCTACRWSSTTSLARDAAIGAQSARAGYKGRFVRFRRGGDDNGKDATGSRLARLRRRLSPWSSAPPAGESAPPGPTSPAAPPPAEPDAQGTEEEPKRSKELAFRTRTRLRATGYWLGEKRQIAGRGLKRGGAGVAAGARSFG